MKLQSRVWVGVIDGVIVGVGVTLAGIDALGVTVGDGLGPIITVVSRLKLQSRVGVGVKVGVIVGVGVGDGETSNLTTSKLKLQSRV